MKSIVLPTDEVNKQKAHLNDYGWDTNPWVWVVEFKQIGKEDA